MLVLPAYFFYYCEQRCITVYIFSLITSYTIKSACANLYFHDQEKDGNTVDVKATKEMISKGYRLVLDSKSSDENLVSSYLI
jgi:hypothetical protein